jgi:hypothetical protein
MKTLNSSVSVLALGASLIMVQPIQATAGDEESASPTDSAAQTSAATAPAKLPYGVEDVLKLTRAQVSEDVVVNYIQNSGTVYNLGSSDIVYLRNEGVPDRVINTMLEQRKKVTEAAVAASAQPAQPAPQSYAPAEPAQPAPVYVEPPATPPPSTVYVIPYSQAYYGYYGPYYSGYWGPSVSFGFRFGGGGHWHRHGRW